MHTILWYQVFLSNINNLHTILWYEVFLSNTNNLHTVLWYQVFLSNTNNLHTILWYQVFLSNTNNLHTILWYQAFLSNTNNLHTILWYQVFLSNTNNLCTQFYGIKWFLLLWPRKWSLMKTQTRILDNRLYYPRKIELHRKGKKSHTVWITRYWSASLADQSLSTNNGEKSPLWWDG